MLKWNKEVNGQDIVSSDYISNMEKEMDEICRMLSEETKEFDAKKFFSKIFGYIEKKDRLLYTNISNYIFTLNDEQFGVLQTNVDNVVNYVYSNSFKIDFAEDLKKQRREVERSQRVVLKMWDHVNLARRQYILFQHKDDDYAKIVDEKMESASTKIYKEMNMQLISLVAIFTALSFLIFGSVSSLDNIFLGAKDIPILKLIMVGCIWCFCIMNLVFSFMFFVARLTKLSIKSVDDINANIVQKYPLVCWSNFAIVVILVTSTWLYYVRKYGYTEKIDQFTQNHANIVSIVGFCVITIISSLVAKKMYDLWKENKSGKE